jgi:EAL domain-containing protein (putative c-di-GMP-specific phosphodiesterase class I)
MIAHSVDRLLAPAGTLLFAEGESGEVAYLIRSGSVEIFVSRPHGVLTLATRGPGEIFGEMAIIDAGPRAASARARTDCELTPVSRQQFTHRLTQVDPVLRMCLSVVIERCRGTVAMLDRCSDVDPLDKEASTWKSDFLLATSMLSLESELRLAVRCNELELHFQPIVEMEKNRLAGFEALMRWRHPECGFLPPSEFIPVAEASGLIVDLTSWCLTEVSRIAPLIARAASANPRAIDPLLFSINVSGLDIVQSSFPDSIRQALHLSGLTPNSMQLEITESVLMKEPARAAAALEACRHLGISIAVDDFGTGYSSLSHLSTLPITTLKIDRTFVRSMVTNPINRRIIKTILRLADELEISVVAEGVEDRDEARDLARMGCTFGQGYHFARPMPLEQAINLARSWGTFDGAFAGNPRRGGDGRDTTPLVFPGATVRRIR